MRASTAMARADRAIGLLACSAASRVQSHTTKKMRAIRQLQRASMESKATFAYSGSLRCSVESCQWLRPTRRQEFRGGLRADGSKIGSTLELSAVEQRHLAVQRYPWAQQSRTDDRVICFLESPRE